MDYWGAGGMQKRHACLLLLLLCDSILIFDININDINII